MAEILTPDLCVIGAGLAGLSAVAAARALGASVVVVERGRLGGDYLNAGVVPSRAMAAVAAHAQAVRSGAALGISADEPRINTRRVHDYVLGVVAGLAVNDAEARLEALGAQLVKAAGRFIDHRTLAAGEYEIRARRFILATGARSVVPAVTGLDAVPFFTSETIFDNTRKLTHLAILGGGPVGLELAQSYRRLGTQVTVVEPGSALAGFDPELVLVALQRMREEGVDIREQTSVSAIQARSQGIGVVVRSGDSEELLDVSHILVAGARLPVLEGLDLDKAGIKRRAADPDRLELTAGLATSNRRVLAVGDVTGGPQYAHAAALEAEAAVRHALLGAPVRIDRGRVPRIVYTDPEVAEIGPTEDEARKRHGSGFRVVRASFADNARARAGRAAYGTAKLMVGRNGRILGAGFAGERAAELISLLALAVSSRLTVRDLRDFLPPHPTYAELVQRLGAEALREQAASPLMQRLVSLVRLIP